MPPAEASQNAIRVSVALLDFHQRPVSRGCSR
jgi:hypothetical protein